MPFGDETFDIVLSSGALHHINNNFDDHEQTVREMVRVLKPGGKILIGDITHMIEATELKMRSMGVECNVKPTTRFFGIDMSVMVGMKTK